MPKSPKNNVIDIRSGKAITPNPKNISKRKSSEKKTAYAWEFKPRFRRGAFGWKSQPAISRIKEAVTEIKKVARKDATLGAEGAVIFLERLSPAIEHVDSSSGAIGSAVYKAVEDLVQIIGAALAETEVREDWLDRLWKAHEEDRIPYIECLTDYWGDLCVSADLASRWADDLMPCVRLAWTDTTPGAFFHGTSACLSALLRAGRNEEILELLKLKRNPLWDYQKFGVQALANMGRTDEALQLAESNKHWHGDYASIALTCENILLKAGRWEEAYERYAIEAHRANSYLATYRAIAKKYPDFEPRRILGDLIDASPGEEGKWFATAKDLKFFDLAASLAQTSPCDPRTLARAARDHVQSNPQFCLDVGMAALAWLFKGYGYEVTGADVFAAYEPTMAAAKALGQEESVRENIREAVKYGLSKNNWVAGILAREMDLTT